jgi:hypothetical protein
MSPGGTSQKQMKQGTSTNNSPNPNNASGSAGEQGSNRRKQGLKNLLSMRVQQAEEFHAKLLQEKAELDERVAAMETQQALVQAEVE